MDKCITELLLIHPTIFKHFININLKQFCWKKELLHDVNSKQDSTWISIKQGFYIGKHENVALILEQKHIKHKSMAEKKNQISFFLFFFWLHRTAFRVLALQPGIEPGPPALESQRANSWTAREFPDF